MKLRNNNSGITLIALAVTIVVLTILMVSVTAGVTSTLNLRNYFKKKEDIIALSSAVQLYYLENDGELPIFYDENNKPKNNEDISNFIAYLKMYKDRNPNDNDNYYIIDVSKLSDKKLVLNDTDDIYILNEKTLTVYSKKGYLVEGGVDRHYTASIEFSGGQFAKDYYENNGNYPLISAVYIGSNKQNEKIARLGDTIQVKLISAIYNFDEFQSKPERDSIRLKIKDDEHEWTSGDDNIIDLKINKRLCSYTFKLPDKYEISGTDLENMKNGYITIIQNEEKDIIYYNGNNTIANSEREFENKKISFYIDEEDNEEGTLEKLIQNSMENGKVNYEKLFSPTNLQLEFDRDNNTVKINTNKYKVYEDGTYTRIYPLSLIIKNIRGELITDADIVISKNGENINYENNLYISANDTIDINISKEGYETYNEQFTISNITTKVIKLTPVSYTITVAADTTQYNNAEAQIYVNGVEIDRQKETVQVAAYYGDEVTYYVRAPYYKTVSETFTLTEDISKTIDQMEYLIEVEDEEYYFKAFSDYVWKTRN